MAQPNTPPVAAPTLSLKQLPAQVAAWAADWQRVFMFGAMACVMMVSPATYDAANRATIARHVYLTTWRILPGFIFMAAIVSWVLIRVVLVTAVHYGLAKVALDLVVRVLVLEVIPLFAVLYVAMQNALSTREGASGIFIPRDLDVLGAAQTDRVRDELVPRVIAYGFSVLTMVVVSGLLTLLIAYLSVYGFSRWGMGEFERTVGQAFGQVAALTFVFKVAFSSLAVAVIPIAASLNTVSPSWQSSLGITPYANPDSTSRLQPGTLRLVLTLLVIQGFGLALQFL